MPLQDRDGHATEGVSTKKTWAIDWDKLLPNPDNPRDLTEPAEQAALEELIADLSPGYDPDRPLYVREIKIGPDTGKFMVWDGNRRYYALGTILERDPEYSRKIDCVKVPAGTSEIDLEYISLRSPSRPLEPIAEANQIYRLLRKGQTEEDIATRMHKNVDYVRGRLELREAPEPLKAMVTAHQIAPTEARKVMKTADPDATLARAVKAADGGKVRTRHVREASEPKVVQPRLSPEQKSIQRVLTIWDGWRRRRDHCSEDFIIAVEAMRDLLPHDAEAA